MAYKLRLDILIGLGFAYSLMTLFKLSAMAGAYGAHFSWSYIALPLIGAFCGLAGSYTLLGAFALVRMLGLLCGLSVFGFFGIPTFCASLYWSSESKFVRVAIPALCMLLFVIHPVGFYAAPYALYWLIPIGICWVRSGNSFLTALGSTFTAHAVGSVMHLYLLDSMSSAGWLQLIPVVAVERLCLALGTWLLYVGLSVYAHKMCLVVSRYRSIT